MPRIQIKRGLKANLPTASMLSGEAHFTTDRGTLHVATGATTRLPVVPAIDDLTTIAAVDGAADFLILHDASASGQKEGKITVNAFKTALNIPASDLGRKGGYRRRRHFWLYLGNQRNRWGYSRQYVYGVDQGCW